jgi:hypothetical protein
MVGRDLVRVTLVSTACARAEVWQAFAPKDTGSITLPQQPSVRRGYLAPISPATWFYAPAAESKSKAHAKARVEGSLTARTQQSHSAHTAAQQALRAVFERSRCFGG